MRENVPPSTPAVVLIVNVFARPGTPSIRRWPCASRQTRTRSSMSSCPAMIRLISNRACSRRSFASAGEGTGRSVRGSVTSSPSVGGTESYTRAGEPKFLLRRLRSILTNPTGSSAEGSGARLLPLPAIQRDRSDHGDPGGCRSSNRNTVARLGPTAGRDLEVVTVRGSKLPDRDRGRLDLLRRVRTGRRQAPQHAGRRRVRLSADCVAVAVRHHDEQAPAVHELELEPEELRIALRLAEERERRAEIRRRVDYRRLDLVPGLVSGLERLVQLLRSSLVDSGRQRQEAVAHEQVVARRVAVRARDAWKGEEEADRDERSRASSRGHRSPGGSRQDTLPRRHRARAATLRGGQAAISSGGSVDQDDFEWCLPGRRDLERETPVADHDEGR